MKRSFYLGALVLCLFGNVACASYLDKLLSNNSKFKSLISKSDEKQKRLHLFEKKNTKRTENTLFERNEPFYLGRIVVKKRDFNSINSEDVMKKTMAQEKISSAEEKLWKVRAKIKSYSAHREALLTAFRYELLNLDTLIEDYVEKFYK
jgi:patatin-like phospholipase/acyl hydrolase